MNMTWRLNKILLFVVALLFASAVPAFASDYYVANSVNGLGNGSNCANADSFTGSYITTAGNWVAGITWHLCGTITASAGGSGITTLGSGSSGNPIIIKFETNAILESSYFGQVSSPFSNSPCSSNCYAGISIMHSYIIVDGGTNGIIQNTANGTNLGNYQYSEGVFISPSSSGVIVRNLTIQHIYDNASTSDCSPDTTGPPCDIGGVGSWDVSVSIGASAISICNNYLYDARIELLRQEPRQQMLSTLTARATLSQTELISS